MWPEGRALGGSGFTIGLLVSWSCAVSTWGGTGSRVPLRVQLRTGPFLVLFHRVLVTNPVRVLHVDHHLLHPIVVGVCDVATAGDSAGKG